MIEGFFLRFFSSCVVFAIISVFTDKSLTKIKRSSPPEFKKEFRREIEELIKDAEKLGSVKYRFKLVEEITNEQTGLIKSIDRPSASAAHSRHKNGVISRLKELEDKKADIFRSILDDGLDPMITIVDPQTGAPQKLKMSEALAMRENMNQKLPKTESIFSRRNVTHLRVVKDEENNDESKPGNPTLH